jgi:DNA-binding transcriptional ArsR family regulator
MVSLWSALEAPRRRAILRLVLDVERSAGEIRARMPDVTFGAVSQHLAVLRTAGLVQQRKDGRHRWYRARPEALAPVARWLSGVWDGALPELQALAEAEERGRRRARTPGKRR